VSRFGKLPTLLREAAVSNAPAALARCCCDGAVADGNVGRATAPPLNACRALLSHRAQQQGKARIPGQHFPGVADQMMVEEQ
jgi:hypothetical protein